MVAVNKHVRLNLLAEQVWNLALFSSDNRRVCFLFSFCKLENNNAFGILYQSWIVLFVTYEQLQLSC